MKDDTFRPSCPDYSQILYGSDEIIHPERFGRATGSPLPGRRFRRFAMRTYE
ncbi:hypothetical protein MYX84_10065 [Acidobacteria bacterium AH-259-O06]|nr:hypothetical protein [Acidobacteria bacterium AH-259-O06]